MCSQVFDVLSTMYAARESPVMFQIVLATELDSKPRASARGLGRALGAHWASATNSFQDRSDNSGGWHSL